MEDGLALGPRDRLDRPRKGTEGSLHRPPPRRKGDNRPATARGLRGSRRQATPVRVHAKSPRCRLRTPGEDL
eukprot:238215-Pyramimonas_sp.AAC.1